jgi:hypothetical protein
LPFETETNTLSAQQEEDEARYLQLLNQLFASKAFYYSYTLDLTKNLQSVFSNEKSEQHEDHFFWNQYVSRELITAKCAKWIVPIIRGFVSITQAKIYGEDFDFILISRLSCKRVGTRYNTRGIDAKGNAANFCETEQIICYKQKLMSFLQIRGSVPLYWSQKVNLKYKPKIQISQRDPSVGFKSHFDDLLARYNDVVCVNLIDQKGGEKLLGDLFREQSKKLNNPNVKYVEFDFHHEVKGMNYDAIEKLVKIVSNDLERYKYFYLDSTGEIKLTQNGVPRVNCIDSLDRTNVVESEFAKMVLEKQFKDLGIFKPGDTIQDHPDFLHIFKNVWADNADEISLLYSGTPALKTDFTRTGKRSIWGLINDGTNSITRYYLNNFSDGVRQDALNLFLGKYVVNPKEESPFAVHSALTYVYTLLKYSLFIGMFMAVANILRLPTDTQRLDRLYFVFVWFIFTFIIYRILIWQGRHVVNNPVLENRKKQA